MYIQQGVLPLVSGPIYSKQKIPRGLLKQYPGQQTSWPSACICLFYANTQLPEVWAVASLLFTLQLDYIYLEIIWLVCVCVCVLLKILKLLFLK